MPRVRGGRFSSSSNGRAYPNVGGVRGGRFAATNTGVRFPPASAAATFDDDNLPWLVNVDVMMTPISHTNWNTNTLQSASIYRGSRDSSGAQNDQIDFSVVLAAGTWTFELIHYKGADHGIYSVQLDAVEKGTIDAYNGTTVDDQRSQIAGIVVAASAKVTLRLKMATKNASSSSYYGKIQHLQLKRTA